MANFIAYMSQNVDKLDEFRPIIMAIASKHSSVGVLASHYPIMRTHLVLAIIEVMGDEVPPSVINAWLEAFDYFAKILTSIESNLYASSGVKPGQWLSCLLISRERISKGVMSITFEIDDDNYKNTFKFIHGQYIAFRVNLSNAVNTRQYYITHMDNKRFSIIVAAETVPVAGLISYYLMEQAIVGDKLEVGVPSGTFALHDLNKDMVFVSSGVGAAVINAMAKHAVVNSMEQINLIHIAKNIDELVQFNEMSLLAQQYANFNYHIILNDGNTNKLNVSSDVKVQVGGVIEVKPILEAMENTSNMDFYMCGSDFFLEVVSSYLGGLHVAPSNIYIGELTSIWARKKN